MFTAYPVVYLEGRPSRSPGIDRFRDSLSRNSLCHIFGFDDSETEGGSLFLEQLKLLLAKLLRIELGALVDVFLAVLQHPVDQSVLKRHVDFGTYFLRQGMIVQVPHHAHHNARKRFQIPGWSRVRRRFSFRSPIDRARRAVPASRLRSPPAGRPRDPADQSALRSGVLLLRGGSRASPAAGRLPDPRPEPRSCRRDDTARTKLGRSLSNGKCVAAPARSTPGRAAS